MLAADIVNTLTLIHPRKGPPRFLNEGHTTMTKSGLSCVYCVYYL